jgi:hypothetical protein
MALLLAARVSKDPLDYLRMVGESTWEVGTK